MIPSVDALANQLVTKSMFYMYQDFHNGRKSKVNAISMKL